MEQHVAVLIPCFNEERAIAKVVRDFRQELPQARLFVFDNGSTDRTVAEAVALGATVRHEPKRGKGNVIRSMFREVDADIYVMVDGDATYSAGAVHALMEPVVNGQADMVVGTRLQSAADGSFRRLHRFGNRLVRKSINILFGTDLRDVLSGYRCFSRRFVKSVPVLSKGFEVETELTLHALDKNFAIAEVPVAYGARPSGSTSKLNTVSDGWRVMRTILRIFKDYHPLRFFGFIALLSLALGVLLGSIPIAEFLATRMVTHPSTAVLATGLVLVGCLSLATGFILDTINRHYREQYLLLSDYVIHRDGDTRQRRDLRGVA